MLDSERVTDSAPLANEERGLIPRPADPLAPVAPSSFAPFVTDDRRFATRFLVGGVGLALLGGSTLAAVLYAVGATANEPLLWMLLGSGLGLLLSLILTRFARLGLAGVVAVAALLVLLVALATAFPAVIPGLLLLAATLPIFAVVVGGLPLLIATTVALLVLLVAAWLAPGALSGSSPTISPPSPELSLAWAAFALEGLALGIIWRYVQRGRSLVSRHDEQLARLQAQLDEQRGEQRTLAVALEGERERRAALVAQLADGVIETDAEGVVRRANAAAQSLWRDAVGGEIVGRPVVQIHERLTELADRSVQLLAAGELGGEGQYVLIDRRALVRSERLRAELMQLLAVEMRNPLTSMITGLEMTLGEALPAGTDRVLVGARRSAQRLLETVTTLQEISELETAPDALRRAPTPLRPIIEAGIAQATPLAQQQAVNVVVEYTADASVAADAERLRRTVVYLLDNAIRISPSYSTVQVQTERKGDYLRVRVSDQGPGIDPDDLPLLFQRYVTPSEQGSLSALGLAFCRVVIEAHDGEISVENTGSGTAVAFSLPVAR
jgi:two-component system, NtrC family, sensor histidine kinase KinB